MTHLGSISTHSRTPTIVLESYFKALDMDFDGKLNKNEFESFLYEINIQNHDMDTLFKYADIKNNNYIEFNEFRDLIQVNNLHSILKTENELQSLTELYEIFKTYDIDGDGIISWNDFYNCLVITGLNLEQISSYWHIINGKYIHGKDANADDVLSYIITIYIYIYI